MRIAILNVNRRVLGGIESHLKLLLPALVNRGHDVRLLYEVEGPADRPDITPDRDVVSQNLSSLGAGEAVNRVRDWHPDLIYSHSLVNTELEAHLMAIAPAITLAHCYIGTCISGAKTTKFPQPTPCQRCFGWPCLLHYFPRHCGGWNPWSMWRLYQVETRRLALLRRYRAILVASPHMAAEYTRHGLGSRVSVVQLPVPAPAGDTPGPAAWQEDTARLLFLGRTEFLKGGQLLLEALPAAQAALGRRLIVTIAGDGPARSRWQAQAAAVMQRNRAITVQFPGWADEPAKRELLSNSHLLVMPSVWPEPFGLVGLEAGHYGLPTVAFDVGGISSWLTDGVNGGLAPGNPPTAAGLSKAIVRCLRDEPTHRRRSLDARQAAKSFTLEHHLAQLEQIFVQVMEAS